MHRLTHAGTCNGHTPGVSCRSVQKTRKIGKKKEQEARGYKRGESKKSQNQLRRIIRERHSDNSTLSEYIYLHFRAI